MAKPTKKAPEMEDFITKTLGIDRVGSIKADICAWCKNLQQSSRTNCQKRSTPFPVFVRSARMKLSANKES